MQSKYEVIGIVGEGAYGVVYKCKNKETGDFVAIKKFKEVEDELVKKTMSRELKVLQMLKHDNIVEYKEAFKRKGNLFLVFEYVEKNLLELLQEHPKGLEPSLIKKIIYQLCKAIKYLHAQNIVHRDIKPENLLVDSDTHKLKLCDFGFARTIKTNKEKLTDYVATRWYRAPELLITSGVYGPEVDFWAIGCIMGELTDGDALFPGDNEIDQLNIIQKVIGKFPEWQYEQFYNNPHFKRAKLDDVTKPETLERRYMGKLSKTAISFMKALLNPDPKVRLKSDDVFQHPYFLNYTDPFPSSNISIPAVTTTNNLIPINNVNSNIVIPNIVSNNNTNANTILHTEGMNATKENFNKSNNNNEINSQNNTHFTPSSSPKSKLINFQQPINTKTETKTKNVEPVINNTTNINIINYNNFNGNTNSSNNLRNTVAGTNHPLKIINEEKEKKNNLAINNIDINKKKNNNSTTNNNNNAMVLTSYNFNKNMKENILSLYGSTSLDKNFKTFYKGDPYNFDLDLNFLTKYKKNTDNIIYDNNNETKKFAMNGTGMSFNNKSKITKNDISPKNKKKTIQKPTNVIYEENYSNTKSVSVGIKMPTYKVNNKSSNNNINFQLPTIYSKNFSMKKINNK